ncbi:Sec-independent protein translocase subunit TatA [Streptomyces triticisoli]|uniref:Sec-independent protein translocase subunit TatA n=1 Tax=Streptomyces triticisoli TaxID=2182797 RepID=UPI000DDA53A6|nr:Sec-independent protein translocase subunit TatA [Streptomyces triticisoli]
MFRNGLEPWHLLVVAIVVIVLFGSRKLPDTARALGRSMRILKSEAKAMKDEDAARSTPPEPTRVHPAAEPVPPAPAPAPAPTPTRPRPPTTGH